MSRLTVKKDARGKWRWTLKAENGRVIGASSQGYKRRADCLLNIRRVGYALHWEHHS